MHLGTLYGSRNLDLFFEALDELYAEKRVKAGDLAIVNIGSVYCNQKEEYLRRKDFSVLEEMSRQEAIQRASKADAMLIVQHADSRSLETIPYKSYDYLNLNRPILGLIDNPELSSLLLKAQRGAAVADGKSKTQIKSSILQIILLCKNGKVSSLKAQPLNIVSQFLSILKVEN